MHFIKYAIAIICFEFLFWYLIFIIISLPSMAFLPLLSWATEEHRSRAKKILSIPILVGMFLFGTLLPALFYSGGIFATTNYFMKGASHPMLYAIIGGLLCFWCVAPSGETNLLAILVSVVSYILYMTILKTFGQSIGDTGFGIVDWILAILLPLLLIGLIIAFICWIISKFRTNGKTISESKESLESDG